MGNILSTLFNDPTQAGGGWLLNLLDPQAAKLAATNSPLAVASAPGMPGGGPAAQNGGPNGGLMSQFFTPHRGLLGNTLAGDAIRGGLAGLGNIDRGAGGFQALGQGFGGAVESNQRRDRNQMGSILAGQQFQGSQQQLAAQPALLKQQLQSGQQNLAQGQLGLQWKADQLNYLWSLQNPGQTNPHPYTVQDIMADPSLATAQTLPQGPTAAPQQPQAPQATQAPAGMAPVTGGQPSPGQAPINPQVAAAYPQGGSVPGIPQQAPTQPAPDVVAARQAADQGAAPAQPPVPAALQQAYQTAMMSGDMKAISEAQIKIAEYQNAPQQAAATQDAQQFSRSGVNKNLTELGQQFSQQPAVKTFQEVEPMHQAVVAAEAAHKAAKGKDEQLTSDMDLTNELLKFWNPNNANLRPNTVEAAQEAMGWTARLQKLHQQIMGGTGLSAEVRKTMLDSIETHYKAYKDQYDNTATNFRKRAVFINNGQAPDESQWNPNYAPAPAPTATAAANINPATGSPWAKYDVTTDSTGQRWTYKGAGDPTNQASWTATP